MARTDLADDDALTLRVVWFVGIAFAWLLTINKPDGPWVVVNYIALTLGAYTAGAAIARRYWPRRTKLFGCAAVAAAWLIWPQYDFHWEFENNQQRTIHTTVYRLGGGYQRITVRKTLASAEGPLNESGERHGKWRFADYDAEPARWDVWYYRGQQVSAVEYQQMSKN